MTSFNPKLEAQNLTLSISKVISENSDSSSRFRTAVAHIEVEKWLNAHYPPQLLNQSPMKIALISKGSGGFGDVIWGVRAIKAMLERFPNLQIAIISDALDKFQQVNATEDVKGQIELISHKDQERVSECLDQCDAALDGPYPNGRLYLFNAHFEPLQRLIQSRRLLTGIEYDRGDYDSAWVEEKKPSTFISGVGDNTYGIFIIDELREFVKANRLPLAPSEKAQFMDHLQEPAIKDLIKAQTQMGKNPLYFGYGYNLQAEFIETIIRHEDLQKRDDDIVIVLVNGQGTGLDEKALLKSMAQSLPNNIASISLLSPRYRQSEEEMEKLAKRYDIDLVLLRARNDQIPAGHDYFIHEREIAKFSDHGRRVVILTPVKGLVKSDMTIMYKISEPISMLTGDQSLSEGISMGKMVLYDSRKVQSLDWLVRLAKRNNLNLVAEYLDAFTQKRDARRVVELLNHPKLEEEKERLIEISHQRNLSLALQQMVTRRIFQIKTDFKSEVLEDQIHEEATRENLDHIKLENLMSELYQSVNAVLQSKK